LRLVKNGVPYDVAFSLSPVELEAYLICFGILDGGNFSFDRMKWMAPGEV
jgi:hypothetical protein